MENMSQNLQQQSFRCDTKLWSHDAFNYCMTHSTNLWTTCSVVLHYNCYIDVKKEKEFVETSFKIVNNLIKKFKREGEECNFHHYYPAFDKSLNICKTKYVVEYTKYMKDGANYSKRSWIKSWRELTKAFFLNQAYNKSYLIWLYH